VNSSFTKANGKLCVCLQAYELSTLTGTQVMLLVASETGHVYTFATRKLQPMITSEAGKALIQTCLNSPDATAPVPQAAASSGDQRMSATGFEETELSYHIEDGEKVRQQQLLSNYQLHESQYQGHSHAQQLLLDSQLQLQNMQSGASQYHHHMSHQSPQQGHSAHHQYNLGGPQ
jgi:pheromone receptor transcription factor